MVNCSLAFNLTTISLYSFFYVMFGRSDSYLPEKFRMMGFTSPSITN